MRTLAFILRIVLWFFIIDDLDHYLGMRIVSDPLRILANTGVVALLVVVIYFFTACLEISLKMRQEFDEETLLEAKIMFMHAMTLALCMTLSYFRLFLCL